MCCKLLTFSVILIISILHNERIRIPEQQSTKRFYIPFLQRCNKRIAQIQRQALKLRQRICISQQSIKCECVLVNCNIDDFYCRRCIGLRVNRNCIQARSHTIAVLQVIGVCNLQIIVCIRQKG